MVSKLLGFETFVNFWRVLVSENLVSEKSFVLVSEKLGLKKIGLGEKSRFHFQKIWSRTHVFVGGIQNHLRPPNCSLELTNYENPCFTTVWWPPGDHLVIT